MSKKLKNQLWRIPLVLTAVSAVFFFFVYSISGIPENSSIMIYRDGWGKFFPLLSQAISDNIVLPKVMRIYDIPCTFLMTMVVVLFFQSIETTCRSEHFINVMTAKFRSVFIIIAASIGIAVLGLIAAVTLLVVLFLYDFLSWTFGKKHTAFFIHIFLMEAAAIGCGIGVAFHSGPTIGLLVMMFCVVIFLITGFLAGTGRHLNKQNTRKFYKWLTGE